MNLKNVCIIKYEILYQYGNLWMIIHKYLV